MAEEKNNCTALVLYEPSYLESCIKRLEMEAAIEAGEVRDPVTTFLFGMTAVHFLIATGVSVGLSLGAGYIASKLAPKPKPQRVGELTGEVQGLMRSDYGIMIPEIYGGDPGDGKGGVKIPALIFWASKLRKTITVTRQSTGGGKFGGSHQTQEIQSVVYDLDFAAMGPRGPALLKKEWGNTDVLIDLDKRGFYEGEDSSNTFTAPYQITSYKEASNGQDVTLQGHNPATSAVRFNAIVSHGAATRDLTIYYVTTGIVAGQVVVNGGTPLSVSFPNSSNQYSSIVVPNISLADGNNTIEIRNLSTTLNLRIDKIFIWPGTDDSNQGTGILDPTHPTDPTYNPVFPPDPRDSYHTPIDRHSDIPVVDVDGVRTGQTNLAGYADFAIYEGNMTQLEDPVIQADIDGKYGTGSTPAYRGRAYTRHSGFQLTRWQGVMPSISQLWEHKNIKRHSQICEQWCDRVGYPSGGYDFSGTQVIAVRGLLVSGRRYQPKDVMTETEDVYDIFFTETDGKTIALKQEDAPQVTIPEVEIGWAAQESQDSSTIPTLFGNMANETELPRRVDVKFIDPDRTFETNTQGESRQITEGQSQQLVEVAITLTAKEADEVATRKLYRDYVEGKTYNFTLSWSYIYLYPGYIINTTRNGQNVSIQLTSMKGSIGVLDCEGVEVETSISVQNADTSSNSTTRYIVPIPPMTIAALIDAPRLRDLDETENSGKGFYAAATPRTGPGVWHGASLYVQKVGWERVADFTLPATMGRQVKANGTASALPQGTTSGFDDVNSLTVDIYGSPSLQSASDADVLAGQNACIVGDEVIQFGTATRVNDGSPNRWLLSHLRRGLQGTDYALLSHVLNERFVLLNDAVQFVPIDINDRNVTRNYRMVSSGQSLDDAAQVSFTWTGRSLMPRKILTLTAAKDSTGDWLVSVVGNPRPSEEPADYQAELWLDQTRNNPANKKGTFALHTGNSHAALLEGSDYTSGVIVIDGIATLVQRSWGSQNNVYGPDTTGSESVQVTARTIEQITEAETIIDLTFHGCQSGETSIGGRGNVIFGIGAATLAPDSASNLWKLAISVTKNPNLEILQVQEFGALKKSLGGPLDYEMRFTVMFAGNEIRVYRNRKGVNDEPLYVTTQASATFPLRCFFQCSWKAAVTGVNFYNGAKASAIYSVRDQVRDFGSAQSRLYLRVYQLSPYADIQGVPYDAVMPPL